MKFLSSLFTTSIGRKILMAVSGLVWVGFVIGHLVGNLQIFLPPENINSYAHFLESLGPGLWLVRLGLLAALAIHVWAAVILTLENRAARGAPYEVRHTIQATLASRTMRLTGLVVLVFIIFHLLHFTVRVTHPEYNEWTYALADGTVVRDVYRMMVVGFSSPLISLFYIVSVGLLSWHLVHGVDSMFQTLGLRNARWSGALRGVSVAFSILYFLGNAAIPLYCYFTLAPRVLA